MAFIKQEQAVEWWKSPDLSGLTIWRFDEDPRVYGIWEAVGWGKTWHHEFCRDDSGGLVFAHGAAVLVKMPRDDRWPSVRRGKEMGLVPVIIWALLHGNRESRELSKRVTVAFEKLGMKEYDAWVQETH
ncbi:MAG: hypothetical protein IT427_21075 [Pirellulales bacterium]|nr:hypothetical protein [Pirellulales bacterium]